MVVETIFHIRNWQMNYVYHHKSVDHVYEKYSESSIYVLSSRYEGFGLVLVEAMGTGLPVVSFACPCGPRDIIEDGVSGYLVEAGDVRKMAEKICYLIENRDVRESMGQAAIARAGMFSRDQVMHRWIELFESL